MTVTLTFNVIQLIVWIFIGLVAGSLASAVVRGRGMGTMTAIIVGLLGAIIGGFIFSLFDRAIWPAVLTEPISVTFLDIISAFIGAVLVLLIVGAIRGRRV